MGGMQLLRIQTGTGSSGEEKRERPFGGQDGRSIMRLICSEDVESSNRMQSYHIS